MAGIQRYSPKMVQSPDGWGREVSSCEMAKNNNGEWCLAHEALSEWRRLRSIIDDLSSENERLKRQLN